MSEPPEPSLSRINAFEYVMPVCVGLRPLDPTNIIGTAFSIGGGYFVTAAHVLTVAGEAKWSAVATGETGETLRGWDIRSAEILVDYDIGFFQSDAPGRKALPWLEAEQPMGAEVSAVGYPYALDNFNRLAAIRAFRGYVVSAARFFNLPTRPAIYELSFRNPRGLSGAPVLLRGAGTIVGMVIGNVSMEMEVLRSKEQVQVTDDSGQRIHDETHIRVEALELGIALQTAAMMDLRPQILGGKRLREHLLENGLLALAEVPRHSSQT